MVLLPKFTVVGIQGTFTNPLYNKLTQQQKRTLKINLTGKSLPSSTTETEDEKEEKPKNPIRRLSRMLSNAGPALVRRVSKLRRKSLAREYPSVFISESVEMSKRDFF